MKFIIGLFLVGFSSLPATHAMGDNFCSRDSAIVEAVVRQLNRDCRQITASDLGNITILDITDTYDTYISDSKSFKDFTSLTELKTKSSLKVDIFVEIPQLKKLTLIREFVDTNGALKNLKYLEELNISASEYALDWRANEEIAGLKSLTKLKISIGQYADHTFERLPFEAGSQLKELILENFVTSKEEAFLLSQIASINSLKELSLKNVKGARHAVIPNTILSQTKIETLEMERFEAGIIPEVISEMPLLKSMKLTYPLFDRDTVIKSGTLESFELGGEGYGYGARTLEIHDSPKLSDIHIYEHAFINKIKISNLNSLKTLRTVIYPLMIIENLPELTKILVTSNSTIRNEELTLTGLPKLESEGLDLGPNKFNKLFFRGLPLIEKLNLVNLGLTQLPDLSNLRALRFIDFTNNDILEISTNYGTLLPASATDLNLCANPLVQPAVWNLVRYYPSNASFRIKASVAGSCQYLN